MSLGHPCAVSGHISGSATVSSNCSCLTNLFFSCSLHAYFCTATAAFSIVVISLSLSLSLSVCVCARVCGYFSALEEAKSITQQNVFNSTLLGPMLRIANAALLFTKCTLAFPTGSWTQEFGFLWWNANSLASPFLVTLMNCSTLYKKHKQAGTKWFDSKVQH